MQTPDRARRLHALQVQAGRHSAHLGVSHPFLVRRIVVVPVDAEAGLGNREQGVRFGTRLDCKMWGWVGGRLRDGIIERFGVSESEMLARSVARSVRPSVQKEEGLLASVLRTAGRVHCGGRGREDGLHSGRRIPEGQAGEEPYELGSVCGMQQLLRGLRIATKTIPLPP
ncbi:hypothetical protein BDK51DRAFT_29218 [Blyttiomyces helicus]|uniref:Uncharacterized protein n=1 Tax=Blyttiomyces helicus TaxID=388810 RepID=A0A4P9WAW4_9FUNG|nr:hypothetical protein BDK51DRAFT_29218 [Blyttiomyces helicus]|eukprot:RKO89751.1 hypothetical protein BDK51DRAFT_29218 [Blyttiomyces helicus]